MNDLSDQELLRDYAEGRREAAFAELVRRHVDLVYSAALRLVRDTHRAEDVTQGVFMALASQAPQLVTHPVLSGWLHCTARNLAAKSIRSDMRRHAREQEAVAMNDLLAADSATPWSDVAPHLDAALGELSEADRDALLLRYFEKKSASDMARILGISDAAAQKRVNRATERLREAFAKRGVAAGASGLAVVIAANGVQAAPAGLAAAISAAAFAGTAISTATITVATKTIAMTTLQKALVAAALTTLAGAGIYEARQAAHLQDQNHILEQQHAMLTEQADRWRSQLFAATNRLAALQAENASLKSHSNQNELLKLRGEIARRQAETAPATELDGRDALVKSWLQREDELKQMVKQHPDKTIPELNLLSEQDWLNAARDAKFTSEKDIRQTLANLRRIGENIFASNAHDAVSKYMEASNGQFPAYLSQLLPFFKTPVDAAILDRWEIQPQSGVPNVHMGGDWVITEKAPVDAEIDNRWAIGPTGYGCSSYQSPEVTSAMGALEPAMKAYAADNNGSQPADPSQILPYLTTPEQQAAFAKLMQKYPTNPVTRKPW